MKKAIITMAMVSLALVAAGNVGAQMVDIGTGQMEQTEFIRLKAMVQGQPVVGAPAIATPRVHTERYGLLEMSPADFEALRNQVAGIANVPATAPAARTAKPMVDIGMGAMPVDEFAALKRMIRESSGGILDGLAARLR